MEPKVWGSHAWIFLHTITLNYPDEPSKFDKELSLIWKALEKECNHYVFQSYDWLANWYKTIGINNNILPKVIVVSKNNIN